MGGDGARVRTGLGHGAITCFIQTQFSSFDKLRMKSHYFQILYVISFFSYYPVIHCTINHVARREMLKRYVQYISSYFYFYFLFSRSH